MNQDPRSDAPKGGSRSKRGDRPSRRRQIDDPLQALNALDPDGPPPEIPLEKLDPDALLVVHRLRAHGHQAYLVGGCVRDLLLGITPKDFDVATSAHPPEIRAIFRNCRLIGRRFRLAHIFFSGGKVIETATFRANPHEHLLLEPGETPDGDLLITHDNVFGTAEQDALRRDFTINGLFYDVILGRVIDYVGGREDLERRQIRTIGDPFVRIQEDPVRILRAVRFAAKAGLSIEPQTWAAMAKHKEELARCSPPRVLEEIFRLLRTGRSERSIALLHELGALQELLPPLADFLEQAGSERAKALFESLRLLDEVVRAGPLPDDSVLLSTLLVHLSQHELIKGQQHRPGDDGAGRRGAGEEGGEAGQQDETAQGDEAAAAEEDEGGTDELDEQAESDSPIPAEPAEGETPQVPWSISASAKNVDELLAELVRSARLPRRIAERARLLLHAQRILSGARKRRSSPLKFVRQSYFADALLVYELYVKATGHGEASLERWRDRYEQVVGPLAELPAHPSASDRETGAAPAAAEDEPGSAGDEDQQAPRRKRRRRRGKGRLAESEPRSADAEAGDQPEAERAAGEDPAQGASGSGESETLPPPAERGPPPGPADLLPF